LIHGFEPGTFSNRRIETSLTGSIRERVQDLMSTEDLIIESFKDIVKDELKLHIRSKIEEDPDLHAEIREAVSYYFQQKARSVYAELKATRAATRLGLRLLPDELQGEVGEALIGLFEKELGTLLDKAL
jgi:ribonucleotide reductase alpha subunit